MSYPLDQEQIHDAFLSACQAELEALKPGNVHIYGGGHDMEVEHFERAALAAAPHIAQQGVRVGRRIRGAVEASFAAAGCNTNLGIVLLCAPAAYAAGEAIPGQALPAKLATVLANLDAIDARETFAAIAHANPGGLGAAEKGDVRNTAEMTLREAMALAADRDRIAMAYVTDFADIFEFALPLLKRAREKAATPELAVSTLHIGLLAEFPDTHVARKYGHSAAAQLRDEARRIAALIDPVVTPDAVPLLGEFDASMKARGLNPGTTADFVVATLFIAGLIGEIRLGGSA